MKTSPKKANGTSLRGYIDATYAQLTEAFGEPSRTFADGKVTCEWILDLDGTIATIYDWKSDTPYAEQTSWHVGGFRGEDAVEKIEACLN